MQSFLVVGKSKYVVVAVLQAIRSFTDATTVVIGDDETYSLRWSNLCTARLAIRFDGSSDEAFVGMVNRFAKDFPGAKLLAVDCDGVRLTNRVLSRLQIDIAPIPEPQTLETFDDKWLFHQFCSEHGFRVPDTRYFGSKDKLDYDALAAEFSVPFVVKPTNMAGSMGVKIITSRHDFETGILSNSGYDYDSLIVQRYIDGTDIDLSLLSVQGVLSAFAVQQVVGSRIEFVPNPYLETIALEIPGRSAYNGVMHIDARIDRNTGLVYLIEANPRFWASLTASVMCGLNFVEESVAATSAPGGALQLTTGGASSRHPALQPSSWRSLAGDAGYRGRLLRAKTFDPYSLGQFAMALSASGVRHLRKRTTLRRSSPSYQTA
ncbi:ATP-grasp domain-containing protein [Lacisediminimonas profundi]|uniref:ATP-grasp domain-containing protein n=1 Tax=Lacisediminimonas profundi TaxID=2603856 RepID=UPI00124BAD75|nr:ATP-grasp domain-containing protein [Lacisediminimonas profundi]